MTHVFEESLCGLDGQVNREILQTRLHLILNPDREFILFIAALKPCISEDHETVIVFASKNATHTLRNLPHCIECEEFIFPYLESII